MAGPFAYAVQALEWSRHHSARVAVLDFELRDGFCTELALRLRVVGVPVIICSGWSSEEVARPELVALPWLEKQ